MTTDPITDEIAYLLSMPAQAAELLTGCDALACVEPSAVIAVLTAKRGELGSKVDDFREALAEALSDYPHAAELAQRSLDARDEYAHRDGRAA